MRADIGIALDGDADRVLDRRREGPDRRRRPVHGGRSPRAWKEDGRLAQPGIVATVMSNLGLERYLAGLGLTLVRTAVGDRYVLEHMREHGFNLGGEQSGHIIMSDYTTTGDGLIAALQVLAVVKKSGKPVSEVCHCFEPLPQMLKNVRYKTGKPLEDAEVQSAIASAEQRLNGTAAGRAPLRHRARHPGDGRGRRHFADRAGRRRHHRRLDRSGGLTRLRKRTRTCPHACRSCLLICGIVARCLIGKPMFRQSWVTNSQQPAGSRKT